MDTFRYNTHEHTIKTDLKICITYRQINIIHNELMLLSSLFLFHKCGNLFIEKTQFSQKLSQK
jgi:hypothetical protein